jgi:hypothetical protein
MAATFGASHAHRTLSRGTGSWEEQLAVASWLISTDGEQQVFPRRAELVWGWVSESFLRECSPDGRMLSIYPHAVEAWVPCSCFSGAA